MEKYKFEKEVNDQMFQNNPAVGINNKFEEV